MLCAKTKNGRYLVKVNEYYGCYADEEGNLVRSVEDIEAEMIWAEQEWDTYEETTFPPELEAQLLKCLEYVVEYKATLVNND